MSADARLARDPPVPPEAIDQADNRSLSLFQSPSAYFRARRLPIHPSKAAERQKTPSSMERVANLPMFFIYCALER